ncbi:uncharacterized protein LOC119394942 [Rhipicephalus sanguineus]|uniref:uncharacterized protein LOC119394942 n=1 Tax=Rhipicephalus sanguineus TaxID=34632 RepID=UPI0020C55276|nr:uncharacterized protein LOC119394942 [Rhipicephalus sanguineus]
MASQDSATSPPPALPPALPANPPAAPTFVTLPAVKEPGVFSGLEGSDVDQWLRLRSSAHQKSRFFLVGVCRAVIIRRLIVPRWVRNGSETPAVLDCEYVYNENDLKLVVKWFFNDGAEPVYQWIPEMGVREAFGVLRQRLDDTFSVNSRDAYSQYRAIRILRPTWELSGKYTCVVTSLAGQDARHQHMTIFGNPAALSHCTSTTVNF